LQKLYDELKSKGFEIVAVNYQANDSDQTIAKYVRDNKFSFRIVKGGSGDYAVGKTYGVQAYPTNYLLDANGKIVWRGVGFNESALRAAIDKLGFK
jgi:thiol-disulfide isomerase/thioredoxin